MFPLEPANVASASIQDHRSSASLLGSHRNFQQGENKCQCIKHECQPALTCAEETSQVRVSATSGPQEQRIAIRAMQKILKTVINVNAGAILPTSHPRTPPNPAAPLAPDQRALFGGQAESILQEKFEGKGARVAARTPVKVLLSASTVSCAMCSSKK
mmetsp:Transcript_19795/g.55222  ORF Transcript_19795/g.55222 Transcript_19795/m.55222 type:complete len:158 (-) Transcript_19795:3484-3957(-)|eukprot:1147635-Pelagomonas_calceolata.AAC.6